jgi:enediyne biosynthesis protein E4
VKSGQLGAAVGAVAALGLLLWWSRPVLPVESVRAAAEPDVPVAIQMRALGGSLSDQAEREVCSGSFETHRLGFATGTRLREIGTYVSNGAGVAANDLDQDGDLDLVFASVDGQNAILWNEGAGADGLTFKLEELDDRYGRGVAVVDVDGDGRLDILFTHRGLEPISYWRNTGSTTARFVRDTLPGVDGYAYAMAWGDVDNDGDLDLVTGSYAAELKQHGIDDPAQDARAGLVLYERQGDSFVRHVLDPVAETLSIALLDLDGDGQTEIWAANDFAERDQVWERNGNKWTRTEPFDATSHSTMSTEWGDLGNDGRLALFSTDMNPYDISPQTLAEWLPMMNQIGEHRAANDPQLMANVLLVPNSMGGEGAWQDAATARGVSASGWSWAGRFGDLDRDGFLDLYVVNGMIAADMFGYLANHELVEENQAFRNLGDGSFAPAPEWQLGSTASGRGMVMADLDGDGDLDIVVNNLRGFAQWFENRLCGGSAIEVVLQQPAGDNRYAIGAVVRLQMDQGVQRRDVRASGGYLSGDPQRIYFGLPDGEKPQQLEITWPDGALSRIEAPVAGTQILVTRE